MTVTIITKASDGKLFDINDLSSISYSSDLKRVMVLDNITENIMLYDEKSQVQTRLHTNKENHILDTAILYFAYSKAEKRVSYNSGH